MPDLYLVHLNWEKIWKGYDDWQQQAWEVHWRHRKEESRAKLAELVEEDIVSILQADR